MTNFEKYKDDILKTISSSDGKIIDIAVTKRGEVKDCMETSCDECIFMGCGAFCIASFVKWLYQDYKKPIF